MIISTLPDEIVVDILSRVPVKSLMRFRCVCTSWRSLISDTKFIKFHLNRVIQDVNVRSHTVLLSTGQSIGVDYDESSNDDVSMALDFLARFVEYDLEWAESCHGLVCLVFEYQNLTIFNPSTRDSRELPRPTTFSGHSFAYGFGYDSSVDDYKVVRVVRPLNSSNIQVEVFSLRSTSWRIIYDIHPSISLTGRGAFSGGALHWLVTRETGMVIVSFDLSMEEFVEVVSLPDQGDKNMSICNLNVLGGCLSITRDYLNLYREVWVMKEYGVESSWSKMFTISYDENAPQYEDWMMPISVSKNGDALLDVDGRELVMYSPKERTFSNVAIKGEWDWFQTVIYVESLVSPNGNLGNA